MRSNLRFGSPCLLLVFGALLLAPASAQQAVEEPKTKSEKPQEVVKESADIQAIIDEGRKSKVQEHLNALTNEIGPRLTGSEGLTAACEWAVDEFKSLGLKNVRMEKWGEFPVGFERGPASGRMLEPKKMNLSFGTNAWTAGTRGRVVGRAIMSPKTLEEVKEMASDITGSYVFIKSAPRRRRGTGGEGPTREERMKAMQEQQKVRDAINELKPAGLIQSTRDGLILTGGRYKVDYDNLPTVPVVSLLKDQWDEIAGLLEAGETVKLGFDIRNHFRKGPIPLYNVIADIPGTETPDEYVVVGGHIDSWDGATGATDNAAGCSTAIEAARILMASGVKPKRTIRFMLWSGEEQGLLGSRAYVEQNPEEVQKISTVFVHDGGTNYVAGVGVTEDMYDDFVKVFAPATRLDSRLPFEVTKIKTVVPRGGSDHVSFIRAGIPGFFWRQRGRAVYRQTHHTQYDTYESIVPEYQEHSSIVIAIGAYGIANLDSLVPRANVQKR